MAAQGPPEEGETIYKRALQAELLTGEELEDSGLSDRELKRASRLEDAKIYFGLARWYLDQGRLEESQQALNSGEELIRASEGRFWHGERATLHSRHNLLRGEYKETYSRLYHELRMYFPVKSGEHASAGWRRAQWQGGRLGDAEDYAMLAVAAFETSHLEVAQLAAKYAEDRGADMTVLKQLFPPSKAN
jgi:ATP/maltotriose-dependent transcriptional regulator MalT